MLQKLKDAYKKWVIIQRNIPRAERQGIGHKIDNIFLDILDLTRKAEYTTLNQRSLALFDILTLVDSLRFFIQLAWETKLLKDNQYIEVGKDIEVIGKMIGGWRKSLLTKTPANKAGERK